MKLPNFEITQEIENQAITVVDLIKQLPPIDTDNKFLHLRKGNRLKSIQSSLAIEANSLSLKQVTDIVNGKTVIGDAREIQEVKNAWAAYEKIGEYDPFSLDSLLQAHALMSNSLVNDSGRFRTMQVNVYKGFELVHEGAKPEEILPLMTQLFDWAKNSNVNAIIKSCIVHFAIEYIHPFEDGNGRMGRLWQTVILNSWNQIFQWIPVETMVYQNQQGYYQALNLADQQNDATIFIRFMLEVLKFSLDNIISSQQKKIIDFDPLNDPVNEPVNDLVNKKIIRNLKHNPRINYEELAKKLDVSRATIQRRMQILKNSGLIIRIGADKNGQWKVIN